MPVQTHNILTQIPPLDVYSYYNEETVKVQPFLFIVFNIGERCFKMELFFSRSDRYRNPIGAVAQETSVAFRVCLPRLWKCSAVFLVCRENGKAAQWDAMFWAGEDGAGNEWWECHYTPTETGVYWYRFVIDTKDGRRFLVRNADATASVWESEGAEWQLTCYDKGFTTPTWLAGGVIYQIFPDRFAKGEILQENVPTDRVLRQDWGGCPEWRPDENGVVRNNDFFGGNLKGIQEKLPYFKRLGVTCLYLNPIFEAHSNHRYDTANYRRVDPLLGTQKDFEELTKKAGEVGIRVILDGVFSHTGADSIYFNKYGRYEELGAYQSFDAPYSSWYRFSNWPTEYASWWGFDTLPEVDELNPSFVEYILGKEGVVRKWIAAGAAGWRLDVADELPDAFLEQLRTSVKQGDDEAVIIGEVWEDASNKYSYGEHRRFLLGKELDSVMNYPFRGAILDYLRGGEAADFFNVVENILENYPPQVIRLLMNSLGTHDTERAITLLAGEECHGRGREWQAKTMLTEEQRRRGIQLVKLASLLQYTLPGVPCLYYGDERGMEGYKDPLNRGCFPWHESEGELVAWFERLGVVRKQNDALKEGAFKGLYKENRVVMFKRQTAENVVCCAVNPTEESKTVPLSTEDWEVLAGEAEFDSQNLYLNALSGVILRAKLTK